MPYFYPPIPGPPGPAGGGGGSLTLFLDTAGGAYTTTPIAGTLLKDPNAGAKTTITGSVTNSTQHVASFVAPSGYLESTRLDTGFWLLHLYAFGSTAASYRFDLSYVDADGVSNKTLIVSGIGGETFLKTGQEMTSNSLYVPTTILPDVTKRLVVDLYVTATGGNRPFTFEFRDGTLSHVHTTLPVAEVGVNSVPSTISASAETVNRVIGASSVDGPSLGVACLTMFEAEKNLTVGNVSMISGTTAAAGTATLARLGLYTTDDAGNATLVARTADDITLFTSTSTLYTRAFDTAGGFPATYDLVKGQRYAIGVIRVGGSGRENYVSTLIFSATAVAGALFADSPRLCGNINGQTDLPTTITSGSYVNRSRLHYGRFTA